MTEKEFNKNKLTGYPSIDKLHERGYGYFDKHPIIPNLSFYNALCLMSAFYRNDIAVDCLDLNVSYDELINNSAILSKSFKELGIKSGDIVTVSMPNFYQALAVYLAANRIGAVTTFLNPMCSREELEKYLNLFESPLLVNYDKGREYNQSIKNNTRVRQIITLERNDLNTKVFNVSTDRILGYDDFLSFNDMSLVADFYKKPFRTLFSGKQDSLILFTSGSTGEPKSVVITNENILSSGIYMKNSANLANVKNEKCLVCVPFSYPYGFVTSTLMSLLCDRTAVLGPNLSADNIGYYMNKDVNIIFGSPAMLELIKRNTPSMQDLSSVHTFISGGDFLTVPQYYAGKEFFKSHNADVDICNGSGNAENTGASTNSVGIEIRPETVGKVLIGSDTIIVNPDTLEELKYGEEGMLCVAGGHVFKEYYKEPKLTEEAKFIYNGKQYLKTGTIGVLDEDGYFYLTGRASRFYIRSDLNKVYCEHIQNAISLLDIVDSCAVVKQPDDDLLYVSKAYIVLKEGIEPTEEIKRYILDCCRRPIEDVKTGRVVQLKEFEIPDSIEFLEYIPRNEADKIDNLLLENMANEEYNVKKRTRKTL